MNVFKISRGRSFKGLTAYMSGGKDGTERAVWTLALNCGTDDIQTAAKVMAFTAEHAEQIKDAARAEGHQIGKGGAKKHGPVLHLAISWNEGDTPTPEQQQHAARDLLKALGLEQAQAVAVAHDDTRNAHLHIAVNLIRPDLGTQWKMDDDLRVMSAWADRYAREHGFSVAPGRADNAAKRAAGEKVTKQGRLSRAEYDAMGAAAAEDLAAKRAVSPAPKAERDNLFTQQADERAALRRQQTDEAKAHKAAYSRMFRAALSSAKARDKIANKPVWRETFQRQKAETAKAAPALWTAQQRHAQAQEITRKARRLLAVSERFERSFMASKVLKPLGFKISSEGPRATLKDAQQREGEARAAIEVARTVRTIMEARHEAERKALQSRLSDATFTSVKAALSAVDARDFTAMIDRQNEERRRQIEAHNTQRAALGMKPYEPRSKEAPTMDHQPIDKNRDLARRGFAAAQQPQQPKPEAPAAQTAYMAPAPTGYKPGRNPGAPNRQPEAVQPPKPAAEQRTSFSAADMRASFQQDAVKATEKAASPEAQSDRQRRADAIAKAKANKKGHGPDM